MPLTYSRYERLWRVVIFCGVLLLFLCNLSRNYSWDVMERACFLKYQSEAPPWGLFFFAHLLEIPLAAGIGHLLPFAREPVVLLQTLECLFGALLVLLLYDFCVAITGRRFLSVLVASILPASFGFWRMVTAGEEKVLAAFSITLFLYMFIFLPRDERAGKTASLVPTLYVGIVLGLASLMHLMALILWPFILIVIVLQRCGLTGVRFGIADCIIIALVGLLIFVSIVGIVAVFYYGIHNPQEILKGLLTYHNPKFTFWYFAQPAQHRSLMDNLHKSIIGIARVVLPDGVVNHHARSVALLVVTALLCAGIAAAKYSRRNPLIPVFTVFLILWAATYLFYEPRNPESWICAYPCFLLLMCTLATRAGPALRPLAAPAFLLLLALILPVNSRYYSALRVPSPLELCARSLDAAVPPGAVVVVGDGVEQRYVRYFSHCELMLSDHLQSGKFDWFDTGKLNARGFRERLNNGRPVYATALGLKRLPTDLRRDVQWERLDYGRGVKVYRLKARG